MVALSVDTWNFFVAASPMLPVVNDNAVESTVVALRYKETMMLPSLSLMKQDPGVAPLAAVSENPMRLPVFPAVMVAMSVVVTPLATAVAFSIGVLVKLTVPVIATVLLVAAMLKAMVYLSKILSCPVAVAQIAVMVPCHGKYPPSALSVTVSFCLRTIPALATAGFWPMLMVMVSVAFGLVFLMVITLRG